MTAIWYEPWVHMSGNVISLSALICIMTVVSTITLSVMGILGILHPLMKLGQSMRMVAENLKDSDGAIDEVAVEVAKRSPFTEVEAISRDFETIVIDFLGFSCAKTRNNLHAPKDASHPFAVVFTDIQSSTGLWGKDPVAMGQCIQSHHLLMRTLIDVHRLYEVKTVGDSFMATTDCAPNAVNFAIDIQVTLFEHDWGGMAPTGITKSPATCSSRPRRPAELSLRIRTSGMDSVCGLGYTTAKEILRTTR
eukprot:TRINITY_DN7023_c0_g1_i1.p2 TRINITY_DN7023_c0_g1~~TRINITY_DN7023_c0_g1_i1.p2  ORF type:complete len:270 (+),score=56.47 TRINITY_DN7023_c0_g1_i1:61-810(+)